MRIYFYKNEKDLLNLVQVIPLQSNNRIYIFRNHKSKKIRFIFEDLIKIICLIKKYKICNLPTNIKSIFFLNKSDEYQA